MQISPSLPPAVRPGLVSAPIPLYIKIELLCGDTNQEQRQAKFRLYKVPKTF